MHSLNSNSANNAYWETAGAATTTIINCFHFYANSSNAVGNSGIGGFGNQILNNSICENSGGYPNWAGSATLTNCVGPSFGATGSTISYCASFDTTATGTGSITNLDAADQFISTTIGSEDLHLLSTSDLIEAGTDLGTSPTNINIDINGRDRDAQGDVWDIGAHEFVKQNTFVNLERQIRGLNRGILLGLR